MDGARPRSDGRRRLASIRKKLVAADKADVGSLRHFLDLVAEVALEGCKNRARPETLSQRNGVLGPLGRQPASVLLAFADHDGELEGRQPEDQITIFNSTGIALQDSATLPLEYERALAAGIGIGIEKKMVSTWCRG